MLLQKRARHREVGWLWESHTVGVQAWPSTLLCLCLALTSSLICNDCLNIADLNIILFTPKKLSITWNSKNHLHMDSSLGYNSSPLPFFFEILNWFYFEAVSSYIAQAALELTREPEGALNSEQSSCLSLPSIGMWATMNALDFKSPHSLNRKAQKLWGAFVHSSGSGHASQQCPGSPSWKMAGDAAWTLS